MDTELYTVNGAYGQSSRWFFNFYLAPELLSTGEGQIASTIAHEYTHLALINYNGFFEKIILDWIAIFCLWEPEKELSEVGKKIYEQYFDLQNQLQINSSVCK